MNQSKKNNISSLITDTNLPPLEQHLKTVNAVLGMCLSDRALN